MCRCCCCARKKVTRVVDLNNQTIVLPDGSRIVGYNTDGKLKIRPFEDSTTLYEGVRRGLRISQNGRFLGYRKKTPSGDGPYEWLTYQTVIDRSVDLTYALWQLGVKPGQESFIAVYSQNRPEWIISDQAIYNNSCIVVALYDTLGKEARTYIINQCGIQFLFCDNDAKASSLIADHKEVPTLKFIIVFDEIDAKVTEEGKKVGISVLPFGEVQKRGHEVVDKPSLLVPKPEDVYTVCYTSGTTGVPKGAMLTHGNMICASVALKHFEHFRKENDIEYTDVLISYLPIAHVLERLLQCMFAQIGACFGFFGGDIKKLIDDIQALHPTFIPLVPRVLHRFYDNVMLELNKSAVKKKLFNIAFAYKERLLKSGVMAQDTWADRYVFKKIHQKFGGQHKFLVIGSAAVDPEVLRFARTILGCPIAQGYGATECVASGTLTVEADMHNDDIGIPAACGAVKLIDTPELGYFAKDGRGEICIRGAHVFQGYYKNEEATKEVLDADGWFHTGDVGRWTPQGTLQIVDRAKMIFKLQQGEYVAPEKIENIYGRSKYVTQSFIYGESLKTCIIAVIVPEEKVLTDDAKKRFGITGLGFAELCRDARVKKMVIEDMVAVGKKASINKFEEVKDIYMTTEQFTVANDLLTPTLKSRRYNLKKHFAKELAEMYSKLE